MPQYYKIVHMHYFCKGYLKLKSVIISQQKIKVKIEIKFNMVVDITNKRIDILMNIKFCR